jgi:tetratricopeptide (TPR) repeat protein
MDSGYFQLARIDTLKGDYKLALENINRSLIRNWHNHKARHLKAAILRMLSKKNEALLLCSESIKIDKFNFGVLFEQFLLGRKDSLINLKELTSGNIHTYIEYALDYAYAGLYKEAIQLIQIGIQQQPGEIYPIALYYKAWFEKKTGDSTAAKQTLINALKQKPDYCFPNQQETVNVLEWAVSVNNKDYKACYYLGNFWYANKNYDKAIECWEESISINNNFPTSYRNLSLAYFNKKDNASKALKYIEKAFELDQKDARVFMELDQLYKRLNYTSCERFERFQKHFDLVIQRDDLYLENIILLNQLGNNKEALNLLMNRKFHPWEGGEGKVTGQYVLCLIEMAKMAIKEGKYEDAIKNLTDAQVFPKNLGEGKLYGTQENEVFYYLGIAYQKIGDNSKAHDCWKKASHGLSEISATMFYNDQNPETIYYQGLSLFLLGNLKEAKNRFEMLKNYGEEHLNDTIEINYFAVSLPDLLIWEDDLDKRNEAFCQQLISLGKRGLRLFVDY